MNYKSFSPTVFADDNKKKNAASWITYKTSDYNSSLTLCKSRTRRFETSKKKEIPFFPLKHHIP